MLRSCRDIEQHEFTIAAVLLKIWPGDDENNALLVGEICGRKRMYF